MSPSEKGRHCAACQKTVIDFTVMSDTEVLRYMAQAGPHVCGRLAPDQLNRPLIPLTPPQKNKLPGWFLLAGLLFSSDKSLPTNHHRLVGMVVTSENGKPLDTTINSDSVIKPDTTTPLAENLPFTGKIVCEGPAKIPPLKHPLDTVKQTIDTVKQIVIDTLTTLRLLPQKDSPAATNSHPPKTAPLSPQNIGLTIYPNPVRRGTAFRLSWQTNPGKYQVSLFSPAGALIQQRVINIGSALQVSDWQLPANVPAGIYIVRVIQSGQDGVYARELVVE